MYIFLESSLQGDLGGMGRPSYSRLVCSELVFREKLPSVFIPDNRKGIMGKTIKFYTHSKKIENRKNIAFSPKWLTSVWSHFNTKNAQSKQNRTKLSVANATLTSYDNKHVLFYFIYILSSFQLAIWSDVSPTGPRSARVRRASTAAKYRTERK